MIYFKTGVKIHNLQSETLLGMMVAHELISDLTITSVNDSVHMENSLHNVGRAFDIRSKTMSKDEKSHFLNELISELKPLGFDVILENDGSVNEHIHVEYDPK